MSVGTVRLNQPVSVGPLSFEFVRVFFSNANVEQGVIHHLPGVASMVTIARVNNNKKCIVWAGQTPWGLNSVQMICDTDGVDVTLCIVSLDLTER